MPGNADRGTDTHLTRPSSPRQRLRFAQRLSACRLAFWLHTAPREGIKHARVSGCVRRKVSSTDPTSPHLARQKCTEKTKAFGCGLLTALVRIRMAEHASGRAASQLSSFTCFPHLPYDIRRLIWTAAARLPRNIDVWARQVGTFQYAGEGGEREKMFRYFTHQAAPGLLHASREARQVGLQHYVAGFSSCNEPVRSGQLSMTTPANIFFNPHSDRVCLMGAFDDRFFPLLLPPVNRVRNYQWSLPPPASVAVNIYSVFISVFYSEREFLLAFEGVPEALLYYWEPDDATSLGRHDSIEFVDYDDSLMEERGICAEIKAELQTLHSRQLNVKWATLVVNGQKVGMQ